MRVNGVLATALYSSAALLGQVRALDVLDDTSDTTVAEPSTTSEIEKPTFTVCKAP